MPHLVFQASNNKVTSSLSPVLYPIMSLYSTPAKILNLSEFTSYILAFSFFVPLLISGIN